ncbi:beta and beta-prime subunits of DNA dependent RNA-polymerase [Laetiporus sulphureus 93-53]|uniref:DNA-directed RNA polymerase subunit n=1 Tax=Laetiporus sulphureus 93-53 TaxID=1314785 RepID=A0A165IGH3_9APHY|nr:beta and beta-prime subunits of DNA dependent RNA-polymerase [Laetiporus sulphureus 93-53]KZT13040.1 beta and beta-prime subunits of DNA dependent RNA-polymerase [Laetiporus sulphureus 93-53]
MNISRSYPSTVSSISFSFLTTEDVRRISVKQLVNPVLLDDLNRPTIGGLYDPALGPSNKQDICATCRLTYFTCPGHFGHIELPAPVFHPLFMANMYRLLRGTCMFCHRFKLDRKSVCQSIAKLRLLEHGLLVAAKALDDVNVKTKKSKRAEDAEEDDEAVESDSEFERRMDAYVALHLTAAPSSKRDSYKDSLVYQARKEVVVEFLKSIALRKCQNSGCAAHAHSFRKEGYTKVIEYDLSSKQKLQHKYIGLRRPAEFDMGSDEESLGDDVLSDEEEEGQKGSSAPRLPKSASGKIKTARGRNERVMPPEECRAHLRRLFSNEAVMCSLLYGRHGSFAPLTKDKLSLASADMFFLEVVPVSPTRFRPPAKIGETLFEHSQNELLGKILMTSYRLRDLTESLRSGTTKVLDEAGRKKGLENFLDALVQLQVDVNSFIDSSKNPVHSRQGRLPPAGVKQGLEKKDGLFRKHMMGKRVNYAARSVISPDVNIEPNEIGIPPVFARKLTFPEPVTPANFHEMRQYVITGPHGYPGATMVEFEDGQLQYLDKLSVEQRTAIANQLLTPQESNHGSTSHAPLHTRTPAVNKKVYRHLLDGDILIVNRQPTLHKPSMMCHKARVLQGEKTIRMHYANCNSYNEMNVHFPQNQVARAEAMFIANTDNQYLVPTSGKPLRGLIQDHVVAGVWMTAQDSFFTREEYFQLLYGALRPEEGTGYHSGRIETLPPAIWKPKALWTGKQIISTVLKNITPSNFEGLNLHSQAKVPGYLWGKDSQEGDVVFMDGELLCGVLDKAAFGASDFGLVHSVYELYGADVAGRLLGILSRLFTKFLQHRAFTCRMDDLALTPEGNRKRAELIRDGAQLGTEGAIDNFPALSTVPPEDKPRVLRSLLEDVLRDDSKMAGLDMTVKGKMAKLTKSIADACMPDGLLRKFPHNHMQAMTLSGAKGSAVNAQQISCALGQQELEGRRVPVMTSGKTLPSFKPFETKAIAGGYVASRFLTGVKPQEFFFHCMAGREGLIDTAVKTSRSGYLQRCLIKHLEGVRVHYDNTVRESDSSVLQFNYGGDALDVTKQKHLLQFDFMARNMVSLVNRYRPKELHGIVVEGASDYMKKVLKYKNRPSKRDKYKPALSVYNPNRNLGSTSEKFAEKLDEYIKKNPDRLLRRKGQEDELPIQRRTPLFSSKQFKLLMDIKYMRSLVEPGEAVGLLASQGIGEPSTQMTLNTFHFAGHGAANVTLGIPRLREIVMTASTKPKTPSMTMKVRESVPESDIDAFCKKATRLALSHVVDKVIVTEQLIVNGRGRSKKFTIELVFYPEAEYRSEYDVKPKEILTVFGANFPLLLRKELQLELKKLDADVKSQMKELGKGKVVRERAAVADTGKEGGNDDDEQAGKDDDEVSEVGDGDAAAVKRQRQMSEQATYDDDEEDYDVASVLGEYDDADIEAAYASPASEDGMDDIRGEESQSRNGLVAEVAKIEELFMENLPQATSFTFSDSGCKIGLEVSFDSAMPKLLVVGIVERACVKTVIRQIPGITDCFKSKEDDQNGRPVYTLTTNGSNIPGLWQFACSDVDNMIDENGIYSNDIYAILCAYGVEAARATILREIGGVFAVYKIDVDSRHLELIADYMTFEGGYKPFNRRGISTNPSPLLKASFETTAEFLSDATLHGDFDDLTTPSSNIVMGRLNLTGTGVFDIVMPADVTIQARAEVAAAIV